MDPLLRSAQWKLCRSLLLEREPLSRLVFSICLNLLMIFLVASEAIKYSFSFFFPPDMAWMQPIVLNLISLTDEIVH